MLFSSALTFCLKALMSSAITHAALSLFSENGTVSPFSLQIIQLSICVIWRTCLFVYCMKVYKSNMNYVFKWLNTNNVKLTSSINHINLYYSQQVEDKWHKKSRAHRYAYDFVAVLCNWLFPNGSGKCSALQPVISMSFCCSCLFSFVYDCKQSYTISS